jgi:hypothetical protein
MKKFALGILSTVFFGGVYFSPAKAADLSMLGQWNSKYPSDILVNGKSFWKQPGVLAAMRAGMGDRYFAISEKEMHGADGRLPATERGTSRFGRASLTIAAVTK